MFSRLLLVSLLVFNVAKSFKADRHTYPMPQFHQEALVGARYLPTNLSDVFVDEICAPDFSIESYIKAREEQQNNYPILSMLRMELPSLEDILSQAQSNMIT